jgi:hypothetical protein
MVGLQALGMQVAGFQAGQLQGQGQGVGGRHDQA